MNFRKPNKILADKKVDICDFDEKSEFILKFIKNPKEIGSIFPTSKYLAEELTKNIKFDDTVLEIGSGTGSVTDFILLKSKNLISIEIDFRLSQILECKFPNIDIINLDCEIFLNNTTIEFDHIISGIPFAIMNSDKRNRIFKLISQKSKKFTMFQYSKSSINELKDYFDIIDISYVSLNIPPSYVFNCSN